MNRGDIMSKRDLKQLCYLEALEDNVVSVEMILNRLNQIESKKGVFDAYILQHDRSRTILDLELSLATLCVLLRKMAENLFIGREPRKMGMINWKEMNNRSEKLYPEEHHIHRSKGLLLKKEKNMLI